MNHVVPATQEKEVQEAKPCYDIKLPLKTHDEEMGSINALSPPHPPTPTHPPQRTGWRDGTKKEDEMFHDCERGWEKPPSTPLKPTPPFCFQSTPLKAAVIETNQQAIATAHPLLAASPLSALSAGGGVAIETNTERKAQQLVRRNHNNWPDEVSTTGQTQQ